MVEEQRIEVIDAEQLVSRVEEVQAQGWRLVQIGATTLPDRFELNYSFDRDYRLLTLRVHLPLTGATVSSISRVYAGACLYENEIHDLWGIGISGMAVDYRGTFYRTTVKMPFGATRLPGEER